MSTLLAITLFLTAPQGTRPAKTPFPDGAGEPPLAIRLDPGNIAAWQRHLRATERERSWTGLPWLPTFHAGLEAGAREGKPVVLWAMNGHPFGCT